MIEFRKKEDIELFKPEDPIQIEIQLEEKEEMVHVDESYRVVLGEDGSMALFSSFFKYNDRWHHVDYITIDIYPHVHHSRVSQGYLKEGIHPREALFIISERIDEYR